MVMYRRTRRACYLGIISQAGVNNFSPLLFTAFQRQFDIDLGRLALLISLNFGVQLLTDLIAVRVVDRIGYRTAAVSAGVFCAAGFCFLGILPFALEDPYLGLVIASAVSAVGGGLLEVIVSPIIEALPLENKGAAMSLLHSFYCWGFVGVVILSTFYFSAVGVERWRLLSLLWALVPLASAALFLRAPLLPLAGAGIEAASLRVLFRRRAFLYIVLMMLCAGAAEQAMCQWASFFAETGLGVSKTFGDLLGPCAFAVLMGLSRVYFGTRKEETEKERLSVEKALIASAGLCFASYAITAVSPYPLVSLAGCAVCGLSVGIMWPGTFTLASRLFPSGGTGMFAVLALAGDGGCGLGPGIVGFAMQFTDLKSGLFIAAGFPLLLGCGVLLLKKDFFEKKKQ